ncbi:MAG: Dabb family protein [Acidobacteria bacterium]|nr:Dabb family protein [Acidobacteriota bacterium]
MNNRSRALRIAALAFLLAASTGLRAAENKYGAPGSVIHVVTVQWKQDSTPEQRTAALEGVKKMAAEIPGIKNVWIKATRVQPREYHAAFAIEFESPAAAEAYADHSAHRAWEKIYIPIREESRSQQITN